jgi:TolB protein
VRRTIPGLAVAVVITAVVSAMAPSAWATFPGLNGQLAYESPGGAGSSIFAIQPLAGSLDDEIQLTRAGPADRDAAWSADGRQIAFTSTRDGNPEIYRMNADGTHQTRLTNNPADDGDPTFSRKGGRIAFTSTRDGNPEIYVMNVDGSAQIRLTFDPAVDQQADWSPAGRRIAFESYRNGNSEIYAMNPDGGNQTRMTFHPAQDVEPSWKANGKAIAFASGSTGRAADIFSLRTDRRGRRRHPRGRRRLTHDAGDNQFPVWSPDGLQIAFTRGRFTLVKKTGSVESDPAQVVSFGVDAAWGSLPPADPVPQLGETVDVRGNVRVRVRGATALAPLGQATEVPEGSLIDTRQHGAKVKTATANEQSALSLLVSEGRARVFQSAGQPPETVFKMVDLGCSAGRHPRPNTLRIRHPKRTPMPASSALTGASSPTRIAAAAGRRPKAKVKGHYQTGASPGTDWTTIDRCHSTETRVRTGTVEVRDLVANRTVFVSAGETYLTRARGR